MEGKIYDITEWASCQVTGSYVLKWRYIVMKLHFMSFLNTDVVYLIIEIHPGKASEHLRHKQ